MRILVTGATGFVGRSVVGAALDARHAVRALVRDPARAAAAFGESPVETVEGDARRTDQVRAALAGVDVLVHAAATYSYRRADAQIMIRENPGIAAAVLGAARDAGTPHVIDVSSGVVFKAHVDGPRAGLTDLDSPFWGPGDRQWDDPYLRSKVLAEEVARRFRADGLPISTIHPGVVIGAGDRRPGPSGAVLLNLLADPTVSVIGSLAWVDVRDVATAVLAAADRAPGGRYIVTSGTVSFREIAALVDRLTGRRPRRIWLSPGATRAGARLNDLLGGRALPDLPARDSLEFLLTLGPVDGASGEALLGRPYRPIAETLADTLRWWAANGVLPGRLVGGLVA